MIVCVCRVVTDKTVRDAIDDGASSAEEIGRACGAGTDCGNCRCSLGELLAEAERAGQLHAIPCKKAA